MDDLEALGESQRELRAKIQNEKLEYKPGKHCDPLAESYAIVLAPRCVSAEQLRRESATPPFKPESHQR